MDNGLARGLRAKEHQMKVSEMVAALRCERQQLDDAILSLERLEHARSKREGSPASSVITLQKRGRPLGSKNKIKIVPLAV